jgi:hypothetical protein
MSDYSDAILATSGLVGYWRLDETTGTVADDSSSGNRDGTINGSPTLGATSILPYGGGTAIDFDGTDDYVTIPYAAALNPASFSVECWARVDGGAGTFRTVLSTRDVNTRGYVIYATNTDKWAFYVGRASSNSWYEGITATDATIGNVYHIVGTYDAGTTTAKTYINGVEVLSGAVTGGLDPNTARALQIGVGVNETPLSFWFNGVIDEVAIYNVALSAGTVEAHYDLGTTEPNVAPVVDAGADDAVAINVAWTRSGSFTDATGASWTATVDYDDGDGPEALTLDGTTFDLAYTWTTNGTKTVTVAVEDDGGLIGTDTITVTVALSDITGGFIVSEVTGTHPTAPRISLA